MSLLRCLQMAAIYFAVSVVPASAVWIEGRWEPVYVPEHTETVWVDAYWEDYWVEAYWEDQWVEGYWQDEWTPGYQNNQWVEGYQDTQWVDGYWTDQWTDGYSEEIWIDGYWDNDGNWTDGYWQTVWTDGHWDSVWVDGSWNTVWVAGYWDTQWVEGFWTTGWVAGYWNSTLIAAHWDSRWVPGHEDFVTIPGYWYPFGTWVPGYWDPPLALPAFTTHPQSEVASVGTGITFTAAASGEPAPTFQWRKNGAAISGATWNSLAIPAVQPADASTYTVVATNAAGSVVSSPATLSISTSGSGATHTVSGSSYTPGGTVTVTVTINFTGFAAAVGWRASVPAGWSYAGGGGNQGQLRPLVNAQGVLEWGWLSTPAGPITFSYTLNVPANASGSITIYGEGSLRLEGPQMLMAVSPLTMGQGATNATTATLASSTSSQAPAGTPTPIRHSADTDGDASISLFELTRVIELYNTRNGTVRTGFYKVDASNVEDGFAAAPEFSDGTPVTLTKYHSADSGGPTGSRNGQINLHELTRVIQFYNFRAGTVRTGQYHVLSGAEDGFAPGPAGYPQIVTQPTSSVVNVGATASFSVAATGAPALTYQWRKGSAAISGATGTTLTLPNAQLGNAGGYNVVVSNAIGTVASVTATLSLNVAPSISQQPTDMTVNVGSYAWFQVEATGTPVPAYQWQKNGVNITGATSKVLAFPSSAADHDSKYQVRVTNVAGSIWSNTVTLKVNTPPVIYTHAQSKSVLAGGEVTFTVAASGTATLYYIWYVDRGNEDWGPVSNPPADSPGYKGYSGMDTPTLRLSGVSGVPVELNGKRYYCVVWNMAGAAHSNRDASGNFTPAVLTVTTTSTLPAIGTHPANQVVTAGGTAVFSVGATGTSLIYQWRKDDATIAGATASSLTIADAQSVNAGSYRVFLSNSLGNALSNPATLTVNATPKLNQTITFAAIGDRAPSSSPFTLSASASSGLSVGFALISGPASVNGNTVTLTGATGTVSIRASQAGNATYNAAPVVERSFDISAPTPTVTSESSMTIPAGTAATYLISATNNPSSYGFSWINSPPALVGVEPDLGTVTIAAKKPGTYSFSVNATNSAGTGPPRTVTLTVTGFPASESPDFSLPGSTTPTALQIDPLLWTFNNTGTNFGSTVPSNQPGFDLRVRDAWNAGNAGSQAIKVLILDTGVQVAHANPAIGVVAQPDTPANPSLHRVVESKNFTTDRPANDKGYPHDRTPLGRPELTDQEGWRNISLAAIDSHGTQVAGCIAGLFLGDPADRVAFGVAPGVQIVSARILRTVATLVLDGAGKVSKVTLEHFIDAELLTDAIYWGCDQQGARVSNSSFKRPEVGSVATAYEETRGPLLNQVGRSSPYVNNNPKGTIHFAATANDDASTISFPSSVPAVNAVGAIDRRGNRWSIAAESELPALGSNYGVGTDFVAPGHQVKTVIPTWMPTHPQSGIASSGLSGYWPTVGWDYFTQTSTQINERFAISGTSLASPYAAGIAALILSKNPGWTAAAVETRMQATARRFGAGPYNEVFGWGMPQAIAATMVGEFKLVNMSTRARVNSGDGALIMGFVIAGGPTERRRILVRGVGPRLTAFSFNAADVLAEPMLSIVQKRSPQNGGNLTIATNTGWESQNATNFSLLSPAPRELAEYMALLNQATKDVNAFSLLPDSKDTAILCELGPGDYSAIVSGASGGTGVALAEVYDATISKSDTPAQLVNLASRAYVGVGTSVTIGGFVVKADSQRSVLVRAVGPSLAGVSGVLSNPELRIWRQKVDNTTEVVAYNDNWHTQPNSPSIRGFARSVGAFALSEDSADAAILTELPGGNYTVEVSGVAGATGICLIEIYPLP